MLVILAKLPVFGLHIWLPKVHVEASLLGSVFLAGLILKGGSVLYFLMGEIFLLGRVLMLLCSVVMIRYVDRKGVVAMSSVLHIGGSIIFIGIIYIVGFTHIVVSPLMFLGVYVCYINSGSRMMWSIGSIVLLVNLGFPFFGAFFCEMFICYILIVIVFVIRYYLSIIFTVNLYLNDVKNING
jgi:NADH:ubiquinone oxidoreductase subunit 4 (subunit M)